MFPCRPCRHANCALFTHYIRWHLEMLNRREYHNSLVQVKIWRIFLMTSTHEKSLCVIVRAMWSRKLTKSCPTASSTWPEVCQATSKADLRADNVPFSKFSKSCWILPYLITPLIDLIIWYRFCWRINLHLSLIIFEYIVNMIMTWHCSSDLKC